MIYMFNEIFEYKNNLTITGLNSALINEYIINYFETTNKNVLVVTDSLYDTNMIYKGIQKLNNNVYLFPMDEFATVLAISTSPDLRVVRIDTLNKVNNNRRNIVVTNLSGYLKNIDKKIENIHIDYETNRKDIVSFLENNSYIKTNLVTNTGEYAIRNFIIDIYPIQSDEAIRIEFFGDSIESIRKFDVESQISNTNIDSFDLYSFTDNGSNEKNIRKCNN